MLISGEKVEACLCVCGHNKVMLGLVGVVEMFFLECIIEWHCTTLVTGN